MSFLPKITIAIVFSLFVSTDAVGQPADMEATEWILTTSIALFTYEPHLAASPDGGVLAVVDENSALTVRDLPTLASIRVIEPPAGHRTLSSAFSPDGTTLAVAFAPSDSIHSGESRPHVVLYDLTTFEPVRRLDDDWVWAPNLTFTADGQRLMTSHGVRLFNVDSGQLEWEIGYPEPYDPAFADLVMGTVTTDGRFAAAVNDPPLFHVYLEDGVEGIMIEPDRVHAWEIGTNHPVTYGNIETVSDIAFVPGTSQLLIASRSDAGLALYDVAGDFRVRTIGDARATALAVSSDGQLVAMATLDYDIVVYRIYDGVEVGHSTTHPAEIRSMVFSGDGRHLICQVQHPGGLFVWQPPPE